MALADLVLAPRTFFEGRADDLALPLLVVGATVAVGTLQAALSLVLVPAAEGAPAAESYEVWVLVTPSIWLAFVASFYLVAIHGLTASFGDAATLRRSLVVVGWGFVPKLFVVVAKVVLTLPYAHGWRPTAVAGIAPDLLVNGGLDVLVLLALGASAHIWYHGVRAVHGLDERQAAVAVGMPVALAFGFDVLYLAARLAGGI